MISVKDASYEDIKSSLNNALKELGGIEKFVSPGDKVLIKPNLCDPVKGAVTSPEVIKAVIELVKEITPNVYVGDLPAVQEEDITSKVLNTTGIKEMLRETNTKFADPTKAKFIVQDIQNYKILEKTDFAQVYFYVDTIINLPKLKSHALTYITGAVKNLLGLIHMGERQYLHGFDDESFCHGLLDVYSFMKPKVKLNIMDAIDVMEGNKGPVHGDLTKAGKIIASDDAIELDWAAAQLTGHDPEKILTNKLGVARGLGKPNTMQIEPIRFNRHINYVKKNKLVPFIDENCTLCGVCAKNCPANAIEMKENKYVINDNCIKCYCCLESCPNNAISFEE